MRRTSTVWARIRRRCRPRQRLQRHVSGAPEAARPDMVHVLCPAQESRKYPPRGRSARDVAGGCSARRAVPAPRSDGMSDLGAGGTPRLPQRMQRLMADQVADIGMAQSARVSMGCRRRAGRDSAYRRELAGKDREQGLQPGPGRHSPARIDALLLGDRAGRGLRPWSSGFPPATADCPCRRRVRHRGSDGSRQAETRVGVDARGMDHNEVPHPR